jgi:hypothetical protein
MRSYEIEIAIEVNFFPLQALQKRIIYFPLEDFKLTLYTSQKFLSIFLISTKLLPGQAYELHPDAPFWSVCKE